MIYEINLIAPSKINMNGVDYVGNPFNMHGDVLQTKVSFNMGTFSDS